MKCPNKTYIFVSMYVERKKTQWVKGCAWVYRSQQLQTAVCCHNDPHTDKGRNVKNFVQININQIVEYWNMTNVTSAQSADDVNL